LNHPILPYGHRSWSAVCYNLRSAAKRGIAGEAQAWLKPKEIILIYNEDSESYLLARYDGGGWEKETLIEYGKVLFPDADAFACVALKTASGIKSRKNEAELTAKPVISDGFEILWRHTCKKAPT
jgi:hypothetical protein